MSSENIRNYHLTLTKARILAGQTRKPTYIFRNEEGAYLVTRGQPLDLGQGWELIKTVSPEEQKE